MVDINALSEPQNHRCCYCGHEMIRHVHIDGISMARNAATKDHIEPRCYDGPTTLMNMVAACSLCNNLRGEIEAEAFYNLVQKWFKRDSTLRNRWHNISREEFRALKHRCTLVHARQLHGLGKRHKEFAFRHYDFAFRGRARFLLQQRA